jgi:hypothetical protein
MSTANCEPVRRWTEKHRSVIAMVALASEPGSCEEIQVSPAASPLPPTPSLPPTKKRRGKTGLLSTSIKTQEAPAVAVAAAANASGDGDGAEGRVHQTKKVLTSKPTMSHVGISGVSSKPASKMRKSKVTAAEVSDGRKLLQLLVVSRKSHSALAKGRTDHQIR